MEKRGLYEGDQYGAQEAEKRTVHLGIDLFVKGKEGRGRWGEGRDGEKMKENGGDREGNGH